MCTQYGRFKLGHTVQLKDYDIFTKGDIVQDPKYPNVLVYMHPGLPGNQPTMVRFLKPGCKEKEEAEHLLHTWLLPWVATLRESVSSTKDSGIDPLTQSSLGSVDSAGSMLQAVVGMYLFVCTLTRRYHFHPYTQRPQTTSLEVGMSKKYVNVYNQ